MTTINTQINDLYATGAVQDLSHDAAATVQGGWWNNGAQINFYVDDDESTHVTVRGRNQHGEMTTWRGRTGNHNSWNGEYYALTSNYWWVGNVTVSYMKDGEYRQTGTYVNKWDEQGTGFTSVNVWGW